MQFGEKIKSARTAANMTQKELAESIGVTTRTIQFYEQNKRQPKNATAIIKLAGALKVSTDYFLSTDELEKAQSQEVFLKEAGIKYGSRGKAQAKLILEQASALFAGGELEEEDQEAFMRTMTEIYFDSKQHAKKYTPKKYRGNSD